MVAQPSFNKESLSVEPKKTGLIDEYLRRICRANIYGLAVKTPLEHFTSPLLKNYKNIWIKREDKQPIHSFKLRGAANKMANLPPKAYEHGVITASAGNHAQGVAMAARHYGINARIVMPVTTPDIKVNAVRTLGAEVMLQGDSYDAASAYALALAQSSGAYFVHPFDDADVIAGQGTIAMEILQQLPRHPKAIFIPVGGGGLIAGMGAYIKAIAPETRIIGVEPEGAASLHQSLQRGTRSSLPAVDRFADGVAVKQIGTLNFELAQQVVDEVVCVNTDEICAAIRDLFESSRAVVEPSGALALAGLHKYLSPKNIANDNFNISDDYVAIVSGANVDFNRFGAIVERAELGAGHEMLLAVTIPEQPGSFLQFCQLLGERHVTEFNYRYTPGDTARVFAGIRLALGDRAEREAITAAIAGAGFAFEDFSQNETAKLHIRYMVGGRVQTPIAESLYRFEFPERPGALMDFLTRLKGRWSISLFHYRNHGSAYGQVLAGFQVAAEEQRKFNEFLAETGFNYQEETHNPAYSYFLS